jgi:hypothetical protein
MWHSASIWKLRVVEPDTKRQCSTFRERLTSTYLLYHTTKNIRTLDMYWICGFPYRDMFKIQVLVRTNNLESTTSLRGPVSLQCFLIDPGGLFRSSSQYGGTFGIPVSGYVETHSLVFFAINLTTKDWPCWQGLQLNSTRRWLTSFFFGLLKLHFRRWRSHVIFLYWHQHQPWLSTSHKCFDTPNRS